uniref:Uncharacterized protein n=1 Tax=Cacopsylla melanoneura TaxID=428564 RepID=A0A8D8Z8N0_9HEMI
MNDNFFPAPLSLTTNLYLISPSIYPPPLYLPPSISYYLPLFIPLISIYLPLSRIISLHFSPSSLMKLKDFRSKNFHIFLWFDFLSFFYSRRNNRGGVGEGGKGRSRAREEEGVGEGGRGEVEQGREEGAGKTQSCMISSFSSFVENFTINQKQKVRA